MGADNFRRVADSLRSLHDSLAIRAGSLARRRGYPRRRGSGPDAAGATCARRTIPCAGPPSRRGSFGEARRCRPGRSRSDPPRATVVSGRPGAPQPLVIAVSGSRCLAAAWFKHARDGGFGRVVENQEPEPCFAPGRAVTGEHLYPNDLCNDRKRGTVGEHQIHLHAFAGPQPKLAVNTQPAPAEIQRLEALRPKNDAHGAAKRGRLRAAKLPALGRVCWAHPKRSVSPARPQADTSIVTIEARRSCTLVDSEDRARLMLPQDADGPLPTRDSMGTHVSISSINAIMTSANELPVGPAARLTISGNRCTRS
jgi:hypothetical protein